MVGFLGNQALPPADAYTREESVEQIDKRLGYRNKVVNGDFESWQEGDSKSSTGNFYAADVWKIQKGNGAVASPVATTFSKQAFALGQTDVPGNPIYFARSAITGSNDVAAYDTLTAQIEGVRRLAGQTVTLSFRAKADAAKNIAVEFEQIMGAGGTPSANVSAIGVTTLNLTTTWAKHTVQVVLPSLAGKTLGTDGNDRTMLNFWLSGGSNFNARHNSLGIQTITLDIADVQLEIGPVATPFERLEPGAQLRRCMRYVEPVPFNFRNDTPTNGVAYVDTEAYYKIAKRKAPGVSLSNVTSAGMNSAPVAQSSDANHCVVRCTVASTSTPTPTYAYGTVIADARY